MTMARQAWRPILEQMISRALLLVTLASSTAHAEPREPKFYGAPLLVVDAATVATSMALASNQHLHTVDGTMGGVLVSTYLLTGPVVHAVHDRGPATLGSLGLRVLFGLVGFAMLHQASVDQGWFTPHPAVGGTALLIPTFFDGTLLSYR
jgi:hypothetical protein